MLYYKVSESYAHRPGARLRGDSEFSAEEFRDGHLVPWLQSAVMKVQTLVLDLDGCLFSPDWLEESFGGLLRSHDFTADALRRCLKIQCIGEPDYIDEIWRYIDEQQSRNDA